jgi:purine-binding chemotaxis protein CheW
VLTFELAGQRYGIEARWAVEVLRVHEIASLPGSPDFIAGMFSRRGEIVMAVDIRALFGGGRSSGDGGRRVIVIGAERPELGLVADALPEMQTLHDDDIHPAAAILPNKGGDLVLGITSEALLVVDVEALLADGRLILDQDGHPDDPQLDREGD